MSEEKNIEKLFSEKLKEFGSPPPPDLKRSVEQSLMREKLIRPEGNNGKRLFYFLLSALLITSFIIAYVVNYKSDSRVSNATDVNPKSTESIIINETKTENTNSKSKPDKADGNKHDETNTIEIADNSSIIENDNISAESNRNSNTKTSKKVRSESNKSGVITVHRLNKHKASVKKENQKNNSENQGKTVIAETINGNQNSGLAISEKSKVPGEVKQEQSDATDEPAKDVKSNSENIVPFQTDSIQDSGQVSLTDTTVKKEAEKSVKPITEPKSDSSLKQKSKPIFGIDLYTGPQWHKSTWNQVQTLPDPVSSPGNAETPEVAFTFGVSLNLNIKKFLIETGANLYDLKSTFNYDESITIYDTTGGFWTYKDTTLWVLDSNQIDTIFYTFHYDSTYNYLIDTTNSTKNNQIKNSISVIEVPLLFGYNFSKGKFDFEVKAGPSIAIITKVNYTTYVPGSSEAITFYVKTDSPVRSYYFNINLRVNVIYNLNKSIGVFVMPASSIGLGSIFKSDYAYEKRVKSFSAYAGLRIKF